MKAYQTITAFACLAISSLPANEVRLAASDLLAAVLAPPLESYAAERELAVKLESIGSLPAMQKMAANEFDLAIIAVPTEQPLPQEGYRVYPFAYSAAFVAVNLSNPLDEISVSRLAGIFGANEELNVTTWGDLGLTGRGSRSIKALADQNDGSIALELFKHTAFKGGKLKASVERSSRATIESILAQNAAAIAILSRKPDDPMIKLLSVAEAEDLPAFGPSDDNVHYGDYLFRLSFYLVLPDTDTMGVADVALELLGDPMATVLADAGLIPLPKAVRQQLQMDLNLSRSELEK